uniref:Amino acid transporter transmembrane domain-containing protein n=1 Tax=Chromera velia CCMP2878 TaxID=1169474 RepID=A0A0G4ID72_9ALVE|eukprot:Cvel_2316.t1-p1 / transcript=Cvel_2316.t1 / gene=Cvel_2316 / organism=Chromera_velia_CCMP2878 / gene_product=hypothetical protein / transcript_product=hypothetical protein / location=Cvel_scaffold89:108135-111395(-) / protein_length=675 / sequence_SO=supercontig / SO=protein_coding / is_pseudo=false
MKGDLSEVHAREVTGVPRHVSFATAAVESFSYMFWPYMLPWAFALLGFPTAITMLLISVAFSWHTGYMLGEVCNDDRVSKQKGLGTYQDTVEAILGKQAGLYVKYVQMVQLFVYILGNIVFQAQLFRKAFEGMDIGLPWQWRAICGFSFMVVALLLPTFHSLGPFTFLAVGIQLFGLAAVVGGTATSVGTEMDLQDMLGRDSTIPAYTSWVYFFEGLANVLTSFGGHMLFPELIREMKRPDLFNRMVGLVAIAALLCNGLLAIPMNLYRRDELVDEPNMLLAAPTGWFSRFAAVCIAFTQLVVTQMSTVCLCLNIELALGVPAPWGEAWKSSVPLSAFASSWQCCRCLCPPKLPSPPIRRQSSGKVTADTRRGDEGSCGGDGGGDNVGVGQVAVQSDDGGLQERGVTGIWLEELAGAIDDPPVELRLPEVLMSTSALPAAAGGVQVQGSPAAETNQTEEVYTQMGEGDGDRLRRPPSLRGVSVMSEETGEGEGEEEAGKFMREDRGEIRGGLVSGSVQMEMDEESHHVAQMTADGQRPGSVQGSGKEENGGPGKRNGNRHLDGRRGKREIYLNGGAVRLFVRVSLVGFALFLSEMLPFFAPIATLIGAWGITQLTFVIPLILFCVAFWTRISVPHKVVIGMEFVLGMALCVGGVAAAFINLVRDVQTFQVFANVW